MNSSGTSYVECQLPSCTVWRYLPSGTWQSEGRPESGTTKRPNYKYCDKCKKPERESKASWRWKTHADNFMD